jgi:hypothetical protein
MATEQFVIGTKVAQTEVRFGGNAHLPIQNNLTASVRDRYRSPLAQAGLNRGRE